MSDTEQTFDAFISYRRSDGTRAAKSLRKRLQAYDISQNLPDRQKRKLRVFLDSVYERGAVDFYEKNIFPALTSSQFLIVLATPDAILRPDDDDWILREITDFNTHCNPDNILVVRAAGEFMDELPGDLSKTLPNVQIIDLRGEGTWMSLSPLRASRVADEWLKLIAPLFDVAPGEMPLLRREQERAQQTRLGIAFGAVAGALIFSIGVAAFAVKSNLKANEAISESLFAIGQLMRTTSDLPDSKKAGGTKELMMVRACDLFDVLSSGNLPNGYLYERALCDTDRARSFQQNGNTDRAENLINSLRNSVNIGLQESRTQDSVQALRTVLDYDWEFALSDKNQQTASQSETALKRNLERAVELLDAEPDNRFALQYVMRRVKDLFKRAESKEVFEESRRLMEFGLSKTTAMMKRIETEPFHPPETLQSIGIDRVGLMRRLAWLDLIHLKQPQRALDEGRAAARVLGILSKKKTKNTDDKLSINIFWERILVDKIIGRANLHIGDTSAAARAFNRSMRSIESLKARNISRSLTQRLKRVRADVARQLAILRSGAGAQADNLDAGQVKKSATSE